MQIILTNGGKTAEYECQFRNTEIIHYPDGIVKYKLGNDDMTSNFYCVVNLKYQEKYGDVDCGLLDYYIYFSANKAHLEVENRADSASVSFNLCLTKSEMDKIKAITWC